MKIVPAILTDDPKDLELKIRQTEQFTDNAQIDIMDSKFVPSISINVSDLQKIKTNLVLEVHLMVVNPETYFQGFKDAGAKRIIFHYEATKRSKELIAMLKDLKVKPGIAINPETPIAAVEPFFNDINMLLLLAVNPGFYSSKFIPEVLDKAKEINKREKKFILAIDGGVSEKTIKDIKEAGIEQIDVGSAIFKHKNPARMYKKLNELIK
ncbi:ribulose-phosphate 3-epimerase [Candidatus Margulisiibacteriota bacterium]